MASGFALIVDSVGYFDERGVGNGVGVGVCVEDEVDFPVGEDVGMPVGVFVCRGVDWPVVFPVGVTLGLGTGCRRLGR